MQTLLNIHRRRGTQANPFIYFEGESLLVISFYCFLMKSAPESKSMKGVLMTHLPRILD